MRNTLLLICALGFITAVTAQDHVQWRGDHRDGKYSETGLLEKWPENGPELLWHFEGLGDGHASAAVTVEKVYTSGNLGDLGYMFAFDHEGTLLWKSEIGKSWTESWNGTRTTPLIYMGKIYIMSAYGKLVCMDEGHGREIWSIDLMKKYQGRNIRWGITENLLIDDNRLYITLGGENANVIALNPESGDLIWKSTGNGEKSAYNSPAIFDFKDKRILATMTEHSILGIDASNGDLLWRYEHKNEWSVHPNTPLFHDGYLFCVSGYGKGSVLLRLSEDGNSISKVWENPTLDNQMGGVILLYGRLYGTGHKNRKLICLDWKTGEELFFTKTIQRGNTIFAAGMLYCYDERGDVSLVKPEANGFNVISSFEVPYGANQHWAHLVIHNKRLYVRHGDALMVYSIAE